MDAEPSGLAKKFPQRKQGPWDKCLPGHLEFREGLSACL